MLRKLFFLVCLVLCVACSRPGQFSSYQTHSVPENRTFVPDIEPVFIDADFSPAMKDDIHAALSEWNFAFNGYRQYRIQDDSFEFLQDVVEQVLTTRQGLIILARQSDTIRANVGKRTLAWVPDLYAPVVNVVVDRIGTRDLKMIVMHEIGHTLGLEHTEARGTLMSQYYEDQTPCIDEYSVMTLAGTEYARGLHWDWHHFNYCQVK